LSLPGWQALHAEIEPLGGTVVTVALDVDPTNAYPWIDAAAPTHPALIDTGHVTDERFGFANVPMGVWIDEDGVLVRPAEQASVERSPLRDMEIPDGMPERLRAIFEHVKEIPDTAEVYRAAIFDWLERGPESRWALAPDEVVARSQPRPQDHARAAAWFALGQHVWRTEGNAAAVPFWREAHRLYPENWTYKRQAWTFVTTPPDATEPDLLQGPNDVYEGNWLDDVIASGGGRRYHTALIDDP
jgi:hypothetical protein